MTDFTEPLVDQHKKFLDDNSEGAKAVNSIKAREAQKLADERDRKADEAWQAAGFNLPYDHRAAFTSGQTDFKTPLPNRFLPKNLVDVQGYDLSSGMQKYTPLPFMDMRGLPREGVEMLWQSTQQYGKIPPAEDIAGLAKLAVPFLNAGYGYSDFIKRLPAAWGEQQRQTAWKAAVDAQRTEFLEKQLDKHHSEYMVRPADEKTQTREQTEADKGYSAAARVIYRADKGENFNGGDIEASKWLTNYLRWFDQNSVQQARVVSRVKNGGPELLKAYQLALEMHENTETEWTVINAAGAAGRTLVDPFNLLGMGIGRVVGGSAAGLAARKLIQNMLTKKVGQEAAGKVATATVVGGVEGAVAGGATGVTGSASNATAKGETPSFAAMAAEGGLNATAGTLLGPATELSVLGAKYLGSAAKGFANMIGDNFVGGPLAGSPAAMRGSIDLPTSLFQEDPPLAYNPQTGFYSGLARRVDAAKQDSFLPEEIEPFLRSNNPDFSEEQWKQAGMPEFISAHAEAKANVSKADLLSHVQQNQVVTGVRKLGPAESLPMWDVMTQKYPHFKDVMDAVQKQEEHLAYMRATPEGRDPSVLDEWQDSINARRQALYFEAQADGWRFSTETAALVDMFLDPSTPLSAVAARYKEAHVPSGLADFSYATMPIRGTPNSVGYDKAGEYHVELNYRQFTYYTPAGSNFEQLAHQKDVTGTMGWARTTDRVFFPDVPNKFGTLQQQRTSMRDGAKQEQMLFAEVIQDDARQDYAARVEKVKAQKGIGDREAEDFIDKAAWNAWQDYMRKNRNASFPEVKFEDATPAQIRAMRTDTQFWFERTAEFGNYAGMKEPFQDSWPQNVLKGLLFQAAQEGKGYMGWAGPEAQRNVWGGQGWKPTDELVLVNRGKGIVTVANVPDMALRATAMGEKALSLDTVIATVRKQNAEYADTLEETKRQLVGARVNQRMVIAVPKGGVEVVKPSFNEYNHYKQEFNKFVKRYGLKVETTTEKMPDGYEYTIHYVKLTDAARKKLRREGVPLKAVVGGGVGAGGAAATGEEDD